MNRFVRPETVRLMLVDVHRRAHARLLARVKPPPGADEIADSAALVQAALDAGDWIEIKKRLTAGEQRKSFARHYVATGNGEFRTDPFQTGISLIVAYLVDWSFADDSGKVPIRGLSEDELTAIVD